MRWKKKSKVCNSPRDGEIKVIRKFLFFPITLRLNDNYSSDEETRWLCFAKIRTIYKQLESHDCKNYFGGPDVYFTGDCWNKICWEDEQRS